MDCVTESIITNDGEKGVLPDLITNDNSILKEEKQ
jgi:hypothetical protein